MPQREKKDIRSPYTQALASGRYAKPTGLQGKYDHVRRFWEDELTGFFLQPYLKELVERKRLSGEGLRILDLGCGSGDGLELLTDIPAPDLDLRGARFRLLREEDIAFYKGVDINEALLAQGEEYFCLHPLKERIVLTPGDFCQGLPVAPGEPPYDVYFTSFGTLSHCKDAELKQLLAEIAWHAAEGSLIIGDWLGRYAYEWQTLWTQEPKPDEVIDYVISYLGPATEGEAQALSSFPLRLISPAEIRKIVAAAGAEAGVELKEACFFDRSLFVGRHMETSQYNPYALPLRGRVNSLFEPQVRTPLEELIISYHPEEGYPELNAFFEKFTFGWNSLVYLTQQALAGEAALLSKEEENYPLEVVAKIKGLQKLIRATGGLTGIDPRASIVEPQLAYALRNLEREYQQGLGAGHGLGAVFIVGRKE